MENEYREICNTADARYDGIQIVGTDRYITFTDNLTKSTLMLDEKLFSAPQLQAKITAHRSKFESTLTIVSDLRDAIKFITRKHTIPTEAITISAHAAVRELSKYIQE